MRVQSVPVAQLHHYPANPRRHDLAALMQSLAAHGQIRPLVVQRSSDVVLAGNGTLDAASELGWEKVAVYYVDVDDEQGKRINLVDNRTSDMATYDMGELAAMLGSLDDLGGTGFTMDDLDDLVAQLGQVPETEPTSFEGGFVPNEERAEARPPLAKAGLKEVILVLRTDELAPFDQRIAQLAKKWGTETVTATVLEAVKRAQ